MVDRRVSCPWHHEFWLFIEFFLHLLLPFDERLIPFEELTPINFTIEPSLNDTLLQTVVVDEMAASQSPKHNHTAASTYHTFRIRRVEVELFVWIEIIADVLGNVRIRRR